MDAAKQSRAKTPLTAEEAWNRLIDTSNDLKLLERLTDQEARRISDAAILFNATQTSEKRKRYKDFLEDVLNISSPSFLMLCVIALGQVRVVDMKSRDRIGLLQRIKANKDNNRLICPVIQTLAIMHIPNSISNLQTQCSAVVRPQKQKDMLADSSAARTESATGLIGDVYELTYADAPVVMGEIDGQMWLTDPQDANTQPFVTIQISWKLRDEIILQRPKMIIF